MKTTIAIVLFACLAIASADWLVKTPCAASAPKISVIATNGNCVPVGQGMWYLAQCSSSTSASDYYCTDAACSKCTKERSYTLGSCQGAYKYDCTNGEPTYAKYISGPYYLERLHTDDCRSTVTETEAVLLNTCFMNSAYSSAQYQCNNNLLVTLNYENGNCQGSAYDTSSISVPSCQSNGFAGSIDYACYGSN